MGSAMRAASRAAATRFGDPWGHGRRRCTTCSGTSSAPGFRVRPASSASSTMSSGSNSSLAMSRFRPSPRGPPPMTCSSALRSSSVASTRLPPVSARPQTRSGATKLRRASSRGRSCVTTTSVSRTSSSPVAAPSRSSISTSRAPSIASGTSPSRCGTGCPCGIRGISTSTAPTSTHVARCRPVPRGARSWRPRARAHAGRAAVVSGRSPRLRARSGRSRSRGTRRRVERWLRGQEPACAPLDRASTGATWPGRPDAVP